MKDKNQALHAALDSIDPEEDHRILYVASSYGLGMLFIKEAGYQVQGIDIDKRALRFCQEQGLNVRRMNAAHMEFEDESFDMVISRDFIVGDYQPEQHAERVSILNEMHRVLKTGGRAVFTTMQPPSVRGMIGFPSQDDIEASQFNPASMTEKTIVLTNGTQNFNVPILYYFK